MSRTCAIASVPPVGTLAAQAQQCGPRQPDDSLWHQVHAQEQALLCSRGDRGQRYPSRP